MANITKNLDTIYANRVHTPKIKGIPLYTRIDGSIEVNGEGRLIGSSPEWIAKSNTVYTSPNNIRRLFIAHDRVLIQLYKPVVGTTYGCWLESKVPEEDDALVITHKILNYDNDSRKYMMEKNINKNAVAPDKYTITGSALSALVKPWVCSNIEEVYFDITPFTSDKVKNSGYGDIYNAIISNARINIPNGTALKLFEDTCGGNIKSIRSRFPRIKTVGFISGLGRILSDDSINKGKRGIETIEESAEFWYNMPGNKELIKQFGGLICIDTITEGITKYNDTFSIRDGIYKFDAEILKPYVDDYKEKVLNHIRILRDANKATGGNNQAAGVSEIKIEKPDKSELEIIFDVVYNEKGPGEARKLAILTFTDMPKSIVNSELGKMSTAGEIKYRAILGL